MRRSLRLGDMSQDALIFIRMYIVLVYQLESLVYDIIRLCALVFHFFLIFFEFCMLISNLDKPKFDQHLNKFETWKWKTKPGSFLVTPKWSFGEVLENFMFQIQNHFSSLWVELFATSIVVSHLCEDFLMKIHIDHVYYFISHNTTMCAGFKFLRFFELLVLILMFGQTSQKMLTESKSKFYIFYNNLVA